MLTMEYVRLRCLDYVLYVYIPQRHLANLREKQDPPITQETGNRI